MQIGDPIELNFKGLEMQKCNLLLTSVQLCLKNDFFKTWHTGRLWMEIPRIGWSYPNLVSLRSKNYAKIVDVDGE